MALSRRRGSGRFLFFPVFLFWGGALPSGGAPSAGCLGAGSLAGLGVGGGGGGMSWVVMGCGPSRVPVRCRRAARRSSVRRWRQCRRCRWWWGAVSGLMRRRWPACQSRGCIFSRLSGRAGRAPVRFRRCRRWPALPLPGLLSPGGPGAVWWCRCLLAWRRALGRWCRQRPPGCCCSRPRWFRAAPGWPPGWRFRGGCRWWLSPSASPLRLCRRSGPGSGRHRLGRAGGGGLWRAHFSHLFRGGSHFVMLFAFIRLTLWRKSI